MKKSIFKTDLRSAKSLLTGRQPAVKMKAVQRKARKGTALVMSLFVSFLALILVATMGTMSETNTSQITDNRSGLVAYYAAEAGLEEVKSYFNRNISDMGLSLSSLTSLPTNSSHFILANNAEYWVESLSYQNANSTAVIEVIGQFDDAFRKIRAKLGTETPSVFNDYGLITNGVLTINGTKILNMSIHANGGLNVGDSTNTTLNNNAVASQSIDPTADPPHASLNPIGGYTPDVNVPLVPIDDLRTQSQSDGYSFDINDPNLSTLINNAPAGSNIYINGLHTNITKNKIYLSGNLDGKTIFADGNANFEIDGANPLSNATLVAAGNSVVNGSVDITTSHPDEIDVVFACGGDIELNGSRDFTGLFWANGRFTQNGSSTLTGRVIADEAIFVNGSFVQTSSDEVADNNIFDRVIATSSWQLVSMD